MLDWQPGQAPWEQKKPLTPAERERKIANARWLWDEALPALNTPVHTYLWSRLLMIEPPETLRLKWGMRHWQSGGVWPAMIARVDHVEHGHVAIHITYLRMDGSDKASLTPSRNTLGPTRGGAVRLGEAERDRWLCLGEGIESTLALAIACDRPGWATLSDRGLAAVQLPPEANRILIGADHDAAGSRAAERLARRLVREGRRVRIVQPPRPDTDWNDVLRGRAPARETAHG